MNGILNEMGCDTITFLTRSHLQPARDCQSVTIVARDGITADGLDTGVFVMGRERGLALIERLPGVGAVIVDRDGKVWISSYLKGRVRIVRSD